MIALSLLLAACTYPTIVYEVPEVAETIAPEATKEQEPEQPPEEATPMINPVKEYPAYIVDRCGTIWGILSSLQGCTQKEVIRITEISESSNIDIPQNEIQFFTLAGYIYIERFRESATGPVIDYYKQAIGSDIIEEVESIPECPIEERAILDTADWLIETVTINSRQRTDIYNRHELRGYDRGSKGYGPIVREIVSGFVLLDNGILWMSPNGAEFCPNNRLSADQITEPGRLWK